MTTAKKAPAKKAIIKEVAAEVAPLTPTPAPVAKAVTKKSTPKTAPAVAVETPAVVVEPVATQDSTVAKKRAPNPAFMKPLTPNAALSAVVGKKPLPRTEIVKQLWVYIKEHDLQDKADKRMINADKKLLAVFGKPQVSMFEMAGLIGKNIVK